MIIRAAKSDDVQEVGRIRVDAWRFAYQKFLPADYLAALEPSANLTSLRSELESPEPSFHLNVAELEGIIAGFSIVGPPRHDTDPGTYELWALNVDPGHFRRGIGKALVYEALRYAKSLGAIKMELWCIKGNFAAEHLYEDSGFGLTGIERITSRLTGHPLNEELFAISL